MPLLTEVVTLSTKGEKGLELCDSPTLTLNGGGQVAIAVIILAVRHGFMYAKVKFVSAYIVD